MNLTELYHSKDRTTDIDNPYYTDKGFIHDYINGYYIHEFSDKQETPINFLEIGAYRGGSIRLWLEWFKNINIVGIDTRPDYMVVPVDSPNVKIIFDNAYAQHVVDSFEDNYFDYILDDGPHSLDSQIAVVHLWLSKLKVGGKLIIEDIQDIAWVDIIKSHTSTLEYANFKVVDIRNNIGRYDDIIIEITK